uniref:Uncharacterized protein n=1 Tax=Plectus sambesii TaxID=2011161 RepID=A0A914VCM6_9BILA
MLWETVLYLCKSTEEIDKFAKAYEDGADPSNSLQQSENRTQPESASASEAAGGQPTHSTAITTALPNPDNQEQPTFDIYVAVDEIISKYTGLSSDKKRRLNMPLDETLKQNLDESRKDICADLNMNELVNQYLHDLLSPDEVSDIKDARGSDKTQLFLTAVKKNIRCLITFMIGLKGTQHEQRLHYFCNEEFCDKLISILYKT